MIELNESYQSNRLNTQIIIEVKFSVTYTLSRNKLLI